MIDPHKTLDKVPVGWTNNRLHFFKYMSTSTAKIVLKNRTLRWSTAGLLNDPFELQISLALRGDKKSIKEKSLERMWKIYATDEPFVPSNALGTMLVYLRNFVKGMSKDFFFDKIGNAIEKSFDVIEQKEHSNSQQLSQFFSDVKILSLTIRPDNSLMWSHYANSHQGVVLRLRNVPEKDSPYGMARPIIYTPEPPALFTEDYLINALCGVETIDVTKTNDAVIYRKSSEWSYEEEWRVNGALGRQRGQPFEDNPFGADELDGVIFGLRTSEDDKSEIRKLCEKYPHVEFMQASKSASQSSVDINVIA